MCHLRGIVCARSCHTDPQVVFEIFGVWGSVRLLPGHSSCHGTQMSHTANSVPPLLRSARISSVNIPEWLYQLVAG